MEWKIVGTCTFESKSIVLSSWLMRFNKWLDDHSKQHFKKLNQKFKQIACHLLSDCNTNIGFSEKLLRDDIFILAVVV